MRKSPYPYQPINGMIIILNNYTNTWSETYKFNEYRSNEIGTAQDGQIWISVNRQAVEVVNNNSTDKEQFYPKTGQVSIPYIGLVDFGVTPRWMFGIEVTYHTVVLFLYSGLFLSTRNLTGH